MLIQIIKKMRFQNKVIGMGFSQEDTDTNSVRTLIEKAKDFTYLWDVLLSAIARSECHCCMWNIHFSVADLCQEEQERLQGELLVEALFKVQIY